MKFALRSLTCGAAAVALSAAHASAKLTFDLDFSLDTSTFFSTGTTSGQQARTALAKAADFYSDRFLDNLTAVNNSGGNTWAPAGFSVSSGNWEPISSLTSVGANVLKVYAGGRSLSGSTLGQGGPGGYNLSYFDQSYADNVASRGQTGALAANPTDFASWGGTIVFDNDGSSIWSYDASTAPVSGKNDFYSVALHELGHLLGFGTAESFTDTYSSGLLFNGPKSVALNGGVPVPLANQGHLATSLLSTVTGTGTQQPMMSPSIITGTRKLPTALDWAGFDDLGWDLAKPGDANADASVNFADLVTLAQNYNKSGFAISWSEGDFNYDNAVNFADLVALAQNYNSTGAQLTDAQVASLGSTYGNAFAADWAAAQSLVPEPTTLAILAAPAMLLRRRRR